MSLSDTSPILDYQRLFLFVGSRVRAASLSPALIERADTKLAEFDAIEAELRVLDREEIVIRALLVNDNVVIDLGTGAVDRLAALADKRNATLNARRLLLGEKTVSEMNRPTGSGLSRQLDQLDQTLPNISQLPELPELQGLRAEVTQLQGANAVARQHLSQLAENETQHRLLAGRILQLKQAGRLIADQLRGELMIIYPGQREVVNSFFKMPGDNRRKSGGDNTVPPDSTPPAA